MSVIDWLLEGDPAHRWQVLRDLTDASAAEVAAERAGVEHHGWGARLLALEDPDGLWAGGACFPAGYRGDEPGQPWTPTMHTLQTLQLLGLDPASAAAPPIDRARRRERSLGARRPAVLRGRGRAVHQRPDRRDRRILR